MMNFLDNCYNKKYVDLHIHPRPDCFDLPTILDYALTAYEKGLTTIGLLEHGIRISDRHKGVLNCVDDIEKFVMVCNQASNNVSIEIGVGIEIDYFPNISNNIEYKKYIEDISKSNIDYIVGSVHGYDTKSVADYLSATLDLVDNYPISILGHFHINNINDFDEKKFDIILQVMKEKNIAYEINTADRYSMQLEIFKLIMKKIKSHSIPVVYGSDSHSLLDLRE